MGFSIRLVVFVLGALAASAGAVPESRTADAAPPTKSYVLISAGLIAIGLIRAKP